MNFGSAKHPQALPKSRLWLRCTLVIFRDLEDHLERGDRRELFDTLFIFYRQQNVNRD